MGVYAVTRDDPRGLLVIRKTRGPYGGRFDLPGGSPQDDESLARALQREMAGDESVWPLLLRDETLRAESKR